MTSSDLASEWAPIILEAARNARIRVRRALRREKTLGVPRLKTLLDSEAERAIEDTMRRLHASVHIVSEEGECTLGDGRSHATVDPVDGTTNLARGIPYAAVSIAISRTPRLSGTEAAIVMDIATGDFYSAKRGTGALHGMTPIRPAKPVQLNEALVSMDISKGASLEPVRALIARAGHIRQIGCTSISLCLVASGRFDAHVDLRWKLRATDAAAGLLILREAGGAYSIDGVVDGDLELTRPSRLDLVAASSREMLEDVLSLMDEEA
jgi:myo-inositol-1(or 4)-monophosphatase